MKKFILDLRKADLPERYLKCPKQIYIEPGKHGKDFDVIMDRLLDEEKRVICEASRGGDLAIINELPPGFDVADLPIGAAIEVVAGIWR